MSLSLYRKYRPQDFASVSGQKAAIDVITNSIAKSWVGHAYLFSGSRGCGKTSVARIFAKALNCLERENFEPCGHCKNCVAITAGESLDVIEIDGASNNSVDEVRELKANVTLAPFSSKYKIYIIDEVHMLSAAAFNALLKTLEEPPEHVIFILATTEPHKVPVTIRSRCQHIPFHSIRPEDIFERLKFVCKSENINAEDEALREISRQADGALRDALSLLEQVIAAGEITLKNVENIFGAGSRPAFERWLKTLKTNPSEAYINLKSMFEAGASGVRIFEEMFSLVRNLWLVSKWENISGSLGLSEQEKNFLLEESKNWKTDEIYNLLNSILQILIKARTGVRSDILLGIFLLYLEGYSGENEIAQIVPPVKIPAQPRQNFIPKIVPEPQPELKKELEPLPAEFDSELHDELINTARDKNIVIYCGLFQTKPYKKGNDLILLFDSAYNYNVMTRTQDSGELSKMFGGNYENVILRYGNDEFVCPKFADFESGGSKNSKTFETFDNENEIQENEQEAEKSYSRFDEFVRKLLQAGCDSEIIVRKHNEPQEEEEIDSSSLTDLESEHEKESE